MYKKALVLLSFAAFLVLGAKAQEVKKICGTDQNRAAQVALHPGILKLEAEFEQQVQAGIQHLDLTKFAKTTDTSTDDSFWYDIPIVVHVIHDYGAEYITDDAIYNALADWNIVYSGANSDTSTVIPTFKPYIGNPHIRLHLATIDPNGNPTIGITRRRNYLTHVAGDNAKFDDWAPSSYVNIWFVNTFGGKETEAAAYALEPPTAAYEPYYDGVIGLYNYMANAYTGDLAVSKTINHELGHVFNLEHPWGNTNNPEVACGDDGVDDTPPTHGHFLEGCAYDSTALYDTDCAGNDYKTYPRLDTSGGLGEDSVVKYPDTTNAQNIMDYTYCARMFTKLQCVRMHQALNSNIAFRNNLWTPANLAFTGALAPRPDLPPVPDWNVKNELGVDPSTYFAFPGQELVFKDYSWGDTITALGWTFSNGTTATTSSVTTSFTTPGWQTVSLTATGNKGSAPGASVTKTNDSAVFVAQTAGVNPDGYFEEFTPTGDIGQWPTFNYYNNEFKWQPANVGYYDNYSMEYIGYDPRIIDSEGIYPYTGTPNGDFDDMYSIPFDLSGFAAGDSCDLDFVYSGASRTSYSDDINDTMILSYSTNGTVWTTMKIIHKNDLDNKGGISVPYTPSSQADWAPESITVPPAAVGKSYVVFRFRYRPTVGDAGSYTPSVYNSTGNNFYIDRINISRWPAEVALAKVNKNSVTVVPNPTASDAWVLIQSTDNSSSTAQIQVTDITGKVVYTTEQMISTGETRVEIPHAVISIGGMYLVHVITGTEVHTEKLIVE